MWGSAVRKGARTKCRALGQGEEAKTRNKPKTSEGERLGKEAARLALHGKRLRWSHTCHLVAISLTCFCQQGIDSAKISSWLRAALSLSHCCSTRPLCHSHSDFLSKAGRQAASATRIIQPLGSGLAGHVNKQKVVREGVSTRHPAGTGADGFPPKGASHFGVRESREQYHKEQVIF